MERFSKIIAYASAPKTHSGYYAGDECGGESFEGGPFAVLIRSISLSPPGVLMNGAILLLSCNYCSGAHAA